MGPYFSQWRDPGWTFLAGKAFQRVAGTCMIPVPLDSSVMKPFPLLALALGLAAIHPVPSPAQAPATPKHRFEIGEKDLLLDGKRLQVRCGELHFARVPKEYWRHRLQLCKAMGLNAVCAYLFWNLHEFEKGNYDWAGQADA